MSKEKRQKPPEIRAALKATSLYEQDPAHSADDLAFIKARLPSLALHMGISDPDVLLSHIREGKEHLEALLEKHHKKRKPKQRTYESVILTLRSLDDQFLEAVKAGDFERTKELIEKDIDFGYVESAPHDFENVQNAALGWAAMGGHLDMIRFLMDEHGLEPNTYKNSCLRNAVTQGHLDIVRYLVEEKNVYHGKILEDILINDAVRNGHLDITKYLLKKSSNIKQITPDTISRAASSGYLDLLMYLCKKGCSIYKEAVVDVSLNAAKNGRLDFINFIAEHNDNFSKYFKREKAYEAVRTAAYNAHYELAERLYELLLKKSDEFRLYKFCAYGAAKKGDLKSLKHYLKKCDYKQNAFDDALRAAVIGVQVNTARYLLKNGAQIDRLYRDDLKTMAEKGHVGLLKLLHENGLDIEKYNDYVLEASALGHIDFTNYLIDNGFEIGDCLDHSIEEGQLELTRHLIEEALKREEMDQFLEADLLRSSVGLAHYEITDYLVQIGADTGKLSDENKDRYEKYQKWVNVHGAESLRGIGPSIFDYQPYYIKTKTFKAVLNMIETEGYSLHIANSYAYKISALFGTQDRVLRYLEKWGEDDGKQPLHDACHMIEIPKEGKPNLKDWGDAVLQHGPKMAKLVKFAHKMPSPEKDAAGKGWSYTKTWKKAAEFGYDKGYKNPALAVLCFKCSYDDDDFNSALKQLKKYKKRYGANDNQKTKGLIPDIKIDGSKFGKEGYSFYKLSDGDPKGLLLGEFTNCCQHIAGAGSDCAEHGFLSENGGFYVIAEKSGGQIVGQSWVWRGKKGELCFDSLESLKGHFNKKKWKKLMNIFADEVEKNNEAGISAIHIGADGATPYLNFKKAKKLAKPVDYDDYSDADDNQYLVREFTL